MLPALLLAGAAGAETGGPTAGIQPPQADWARAERLDIVLTDFEFTPSRIRLRTGQPYRLHLENHGSGGHNLTAPEFFRTTLLRDSSVTGEVRADGKVEVGRAEAKDIELLPMRAGDFPMRCSHFLHSFFGMTGRIVVE
jgi:uncharacterized cupredoxin-like copper-binding protein